MGLLTRLLAPRSPSRKGSQSSLEESDSLTFADYLKFREIAFEWADSYDCKDWHRLRAICAPIIQVDYTEVSGMEYKDMSVDKFVAFAAHPGFLGDQLIHTQHLLGATKFERVSPNEVHAYIQIRAAHQRYTDATKTVIENKGHGHAMIKHTYTKQADGQWKFSGLRPSVRWNEFSFDKIFVHFDPRGVMEPTAVRLEQVTASSGDVVAIASKDKSFGSRPFDAPGTIEIGLATA